MSHTEDRGSSTLRGRAGDDRVLGEAGNDFVSGDWTQAPGTDVIDGGQGSTASRTTGRRAPLEPAPAVAVSLDGVANDGRSGEGDNVVAVETVNTASPGSYSGGTADESFTVVAAGAVSVSGGGGGDKIRTRRCRRRRPRGRATATTRSSASAARA